MSTLLSPRPPNRTAAALHAFTRACSRRRAERRYAMKPLNSAEPTPSASNQMSSARMIEQYKTIGQTLQVAESKCFCAGTPWLFPTSRVRALQKKFDQAIYDFIRMSIVSVPTETLECYCEDLESMATDKKSCEVLGISRPTSLERYTLALFLVALASVLAFASALYASGNPSIALAAGFLATWIALFAGIVMCSESYRRTSFFWLLSKELMRRRGISGGGRKIPIYQGEAKAVK